MTLPLALAIAALSTTPALEARPGAAPEARGEAGGHPELHVDPLRDGAILAATLVALGLTTAFEDDLVPSRCRWCDPPRFDTWARDQVRWGDPEAARLGSNIAVTLVPAGAAAALALSSGLDGPRRRILEDFLLVAQAAAVTQLGDRIPKYGVVRLRPYAWAGTDAVTGDSDDRLSFWSGHAGLAFSVASAAGTVAWLRGYPQWRWILGLGLAGATATAWFRVAADHHWATDALAGAAWGTTVGVAVPLLHVRGERRASVLPSGRGAVLVFAW
jgi:hypothetical protein